MALSPSRKRALIKPPAFPAGLFNFGNPSTQFTKWKTGVARVKAGAGRARIVICGDSTSWGEGGGDSGTNNRVNAKERCWPTIMAKQLSLLGIPANYENLYASGGNTGITAISDFQNAYKTGFNVTAGWTFSASTAAGGCLFTNTTDTTGVISYTSQIAVDNFELCDLQVSTGGIITYNIDGGTETQLNQANATTVFRKTVIPCGSVGTHTLNIKRISGNAFFMGARAWNSTVSQVDVLNLGRCSSQTSDWIVNSNAWSPLNSLQDLCSTADLVVIAHTINDGLNGATDAAYLANLVTIRAACAAGGANVLYATGNPSNVATITAATQARILADLKARAVADGLPMVDQNARYIDWFSLNQRGWMFNNNHPNTSGYADWGSFMGSLLAAYSA